MRFSKTHQHSCGIDLHARTMYVCILDREGQVLLHRNLPCDPERFLRTIAPYREDLVVGVECIFSWYWLADLCAREGIAFVLGHALYMKAIHGAKAKNDRIDSRKTAALLKGGLFPQAYVYPPEMRATRDLLRRRLHASKVLDRTRRRKICVEDLTFARAPPAILFGFQPVPDNVEQCLCVTRIAKRLEENFAVLVVQFDAVKNRHDRFKGILYGSPAGGCQRLGALLGGESQI